jgi:hypothetical protein
MRLEGEVVQKPFGQGSKSEHLAFYLNTPRGKSYVLRKVGANAFKNDELLAFVGKTVVAEGTLSNYLFLIKDIKESPAK